MEQQENNIKNDLTSEKEELQSNEYLGTFRWKRSLKFPLLPIITHPISYTKLNKWSEYINIRLDTNQFEPYVIDALSYPMSIIYSINSIVNLNEYIDLDILKEEETINVVILGALNKTECRIALESNYFDEIYYFFIELTGNTELKVNLYFVGEEVNTEAESYNSKNNKNLTYYFSKHNTGNFLKENIMNFNKKNTFIIGLNCGFGAGYLKLTKSWFTDLIKLIKINFITIFTYTNDYEDKIGEQALIKTLGGKIIYENNDNPFKSMTTYKSEDKDDIWACGNYGFYVLYGGDRKVVNSMGKLSNNEIEDVIKKTITVKV
jgi:hypothetical protein